jgi:AcrR family transcriptional regulator
MARPTGDHDQRKETIAEAAIRAIDARGLGAATLGDIAHEMGCSTGVLRHYFRSKDELLEYTKNFLLDDLKKRMVSAAEDAEGLERLHKMLETALPLDADARRLWRIYLAFLSQVIGNPDLAHVQARRNRYSIEIVAAELRKLHALKAIRRDVDPDEAAGAAICLVEGIGFHAAIDPEFFTAARQKALLGVFMKSLV